MNPLLSILIPTLPIRKTKFDNLISQLELQIKEGNYQSVVEVISLLDNKEMTIGAKRNRMIEMSAGKYVCFVDDDDMVSPDYIEKIIGAINQYPDVITFCGRYFKDGVFQQDFTISLDVEHLDTPKHLYRKPHHLCPVKRYIAMDCPYPNINNGEDSAYSELLNRFLLTEYHIKAQIYDYLFSTKETETQK